MNGYERREFLRCQAALVGHACIRHDLHHLREHLCHCGRTWNRPWIFQTAMKPFLRIIPPEGYVKEWGPEVRDAEILSRLS